MGITTVNACGHKWIERSGYGVDEHSKPLCDPCANARELAAFFDGRTEFTAYISDDHRLVTWLGATLAAPGGSARARTGFHGTFVYMWWYTDAAGRKWFGRNGGPGMVVTVRQLKR